MESILVCQSCKTNFDSDLRTPRILPCSKQICTLCVENSKQLLGGYLIECECNSRAHNMEKLDDLLVSQITLACLSKTTDCNELEIIDMREQVEKYKYGLELARFDVGRHYDDMEMKIDIRAETLIEFIHDSRDILHAEIKAHRKNTDDQIEQFEKKYNSDYKKLDLDFKLLNKKLTDPEQCIEAKNLEFSKFIQEFNKLQKSVDELKTKSWYFLENSTSLDKSLLGYNFNNTLDKNYYKIKNLCCLINDPLKSIYITLRTQFNQVKLRHYVIPMTRNRILSCYFTKSKSIYLELFDQAGNSIKLIQVAESVTYFPIYSNTGKYFVLGYLSRTSDIFGDATINFIALYDHELNLIRTVKERSSIESIFMNDSRIICSFGHRSYECCKVFDTELNHVESFGQQTENDKPFYLERTEVSAAQFAKEKYNPVIFGYNEEKIFFYNKKSMTVMCKKNGCVLNSFEKSNERSFFILDSQSNVIEINTYGNRVKLHNFHVNMSVDSTYDINYENVCLIEDQYFAFVYSNKENITIV